MTNFAEIWHDDASRPSGPHQPIKYRDFKDPRLQMATILKIKKSRYLKNRLTDFDEIWNADAHWPSEPYGPEKQSKLEDPRR